MRSRIAASATPPRAEAVLLSPLAAWRRYRGLSQLALAEKATFSRNVPALPCAATEARGKAAPPSERGACRPLGRLRPTALAAKADVGAGFCRTLLRRWRRRRGESGVGERVAAGGGYGSGRTRAKLAAALEAPVWALEEED